MSIKISYTGEKDYSEVFQTALDKGGVIEIEKGFYRISQTLRIKSDTEIVADKDAVIFTADDSKKNRNDFLLCNDDRDGGNENISISGGIWDGNCIHNARGKLFGGGYTGTMINFFNVRNLKLSDMVLKNPECYYVRMCKVSGFYIKNILFDTEHIRPNQDGIHLAGYCFNGVISDLKGSKGSPNDDFVAFNADDCLTRLQNLDVLCGEISDVTVENLESPLCHSFIRFLSVNSSIKNISVRGMKGCCKAFAINMDAARYCKRGTRLLKITDKRYFTGCGNIENVNVENVEVYSVKRQKALILAECNADKFTVKNLTTYPKYKNTPTLSVGYNAPTVVGVVDAEGKSFRIVKGKFGRFKLPARSYAQIRLDRLSE